MVISYKDRLAKFGYKLIEYLIKNYSNGVIIITEKSKEETLEEEMMNAVLSIINIYIAKINDLRKYKTKLKKKIIG